MQRTHHYHAAEADMLRAQLQEQYNKCKQKLVELHNGYQQVGRCFCGGCLFGCTQVYIP